MRPFIAVYRDAADKVGGFSPSSLMNDMQSILYKGVRVRIFQLMPMPVSSLAYSRLLLFAFAIGLCAVRELRASTWSRGSYSRLITTLPRACPFSRYRIAAGASLKLYCLSMTGITFPACMRSRNVFRSSVLFASAMKLTNFWLTNGEIAYPLRNLARGPIHGS